MADKILIVDDMPENVAAFKSVIEAYIEDCDILVAENGLQAIELVARHHPDLVLMDVHMPEMDGFEACRHLKTNPESSSIPVLMVSAFMTQGHHRALGLENGADGYLCKPFDTAELIAQVRGLLRLKRSEDKLRSERDAFKKELEERNQHLRMSEEHWRNLFEQSPDAIFIEDLEGTVLEANPAACALHGLTHEALLGKNMLDLVPPDERQHVADTFSGWLDSSLQRYEGLSYTEEGSTVPIEIRATRFEYCNEPAILLHVRDISDRIRMEQQLIQAQKLESVGMLAGGIAHDFNNILTGVIGNISFAKLDLAESAPAYAPICEAEKSAFRARLLTQQLLTFAKGGAPVRKVASVSQLLQNATNFVLSGSSSTCLFEVDEDLWTAEIDSGQISQVIENLVINAVQAMPSGGLVRLSASNIEIDTAPEADDSSLKKGRYIRICIKDAGTGIAPKNMSLIFDPYFTTKTGGTGLGLATSYAIIQKHEGLITVDARVNQGTLFTIYLPASNKPLPEVADVGKDPIYGEGHILVMDDEAVIRNIMEAALEKLGYTMKSVADGRAAIEAYQEAIRNKAPFDAVILDMTVSGGMGGEETVGMLKAIDPDVKAIVSSGYTTGGAMSTPELFGFSGVIAKPYSVQQLSVAVHEVLHPEG
jgi:two-component system cell cycle sensor histidine kinase/response regulator CckA